MTSLEKEESQSKQDSASSIFSYSPESVNLQTTHEILTSNNLIPRQFIDTEILYLLNFGPKSGYELRKQLLRVFETRVSYGTLYPHLHALERSTLIAGTWAPREESSAPLNKKVYALTKPGSFALKESIASLGKIGLTMQFIFNKLDLGLGSPSKSNERESTLATIQAILARRGYSASRDVTLKGYSGKEYRFEIVAMRQTTPKHTEKILVQVLDQHVGPPLSLDQAMKILVVSQDTGARVLLFAAPRLNEEVLSFLEFHRMIVFDGNTWQSVMSDFLLRYDRALE